MSWHRWKPYVSVARRRAAAAREIKKRSRNGLNPQPIVIEGRRITSTFWGNAWCDHLEQFSDFENRLPRGRTYVRNGSVCHLAITPGRIEAIVSGSRLYRIQITIDKLPPRKWDLVKKSCTGKIGSLLELLQGRLSASVMSVVTDPSTGLFPKPAEIHLACDCPDWADLCKHLAAVLYGVGARLDTQPELLFLLRGVDHEELIRSDISAVTVTATGAAAGRRRIADSALSDVFGIEMEEESETAAAAGRPHARKSKPPRAKAPRGAAAETPHSNLPSDNRKQNRPSVPAAQVPEPPGVTGQSVAALRKSFEMTRAEFSRLIGISPSTLKHWEGSEGVLNLKRRSARLWASAAKLTRRRARNRLRKARLQGP